MVERFAAAIAKELDQLVKLTLDKQLIDLGLTEQVLPSLRESWQVLLVQSTHDVELAPAAHLAILLIREVIGFLLLLLPEAAPDHAKEDQDVLNHLNVELRAPIHVEEPVDVEYYD